MAGEAPRPRQLAPRCPRRADWGRRLIARLQLSSADLHGIREAQDIFLRALEFDSLDSWRLAANRVCAGLLGADMATFMMRLQGERLLVSRQFPGSHLQEYEERLSPLAARLHIVERAIRMGTGTRPMLWGSDYRTMLRSDYYQDFIHPLRAYDALFATVGDEGTVHAQILFHHERANGRRFGARGLDLVRLLFPAFAAGSRTAMRLHTERHRLAGTLDQLRLGVVLMDGEASIIHANPTAARLLEDPVGGPPLRLRLRLESQGLNGSELRGGPDRSRLVSEGRWRFRLSVTRAGPELMGLSGGFLAILEPTDGPDDILRAEAADLGLTARETEVAVLLGERRTNAEIAAALAISPHTARHHTERVLRKLEVGSRRYVAGCLNRAFVPGQDSGP